MIAFSAAAIVGLAVAAFVIIVLSRNMRRGKKQ